MPRNSPSLASTWPQRSSRSKISMLAGATAAPTGWPAKVAVREGGGALHERLGDLVGGDHRAHRHVGGGQALAEVMMSGW